MQELRALVVDDSKVGRLTMMKKLEAIGMTVELVESGQQALDYLARQRPDMIFMDHMMPELDGFEVTRRIKASPAIRNIPVIIISGNDEASFVEEARAAGAVDAIAKPPATEVLQALLASLPKLRAEAAHVPADEAVQQPVSRPAVVEPAAVASIDMAEVQALVERLMEVGMAPLRDELQASLQARTDGLQQQMQSLRQDFADVQASVDAQAAQVEHRMGGLGSRLDALAEALAQVTRDVQSLRSDQTAFEQRLEQSLAQRLDQRLEQSIAQLREQLDAARQPVEPVPVPEAVDDATRLALQAIQAELGELRERGSESRLRQLVEESLASLQLSIEAPPVVEKREAPQPAVNGALQAELEQLKGKVKALSIAAAVSGALLLVVLGISLFGG